MISTRWLALPLALSTGCATMGSPLLHARSLPSDLQVGAMSERTQFELDESPDQPPVAAEDDEDFVPSDDPDAEKKKRRRKVLFFLGVGAAGLGAVGVTAFGVGGRIVQGQLSNGYEEGSLTRDREDSLTTRGEVMNGMAIGSAVVGIMGVVLAATVYGIDHARCGDLPPRRKQCPEDDGDGDSEETAPKTAPEPAPETAPKTAPAEAGE